MSIFSPPLYVRSTTLPLTTFFSFVRTKAPPLPGLTCWNSMTLHSCPSIERTTPFLISAVLAMRVCSIHYRSVEFIRSPATAPVGRISHVPESSRAEAAGRTGFGTSGLPTPRRRRAESALVPPRRRENKTGREIPQAGHQDVSGHAVQHARNNIKRIVHGEIEARPRHR